MITIEEIFNLSNYEKVIKNNKTIFTSFKNDKNNEFYIRIYIKEYSIIDFLTYKITFIFEKDKCFVSYYIYKYYCQKVKFISLDEFISICADIFKLPIEIIFKEIYDSKLEYWKKSDDEMKNLIDKNTYLQ